MDQNRHIDVWDNCLRIIEQIIDPQKFDMWFKPLRPVSIQDNNLTIEVPTNFFREYLEDTYLDLIKKTMHRVIGADAKLFYQVRPVTSQPAMRFPAAEASAPVNKAVTVNTYPTNGNPGAFVFPGIKRIQINPRLNPVYCFDNLIEGECNKLGITAGESIASGGDGDVRVPAGSVIINHDRSAIGGIDPDRVGGTGERRDINIELHILA